jgi:hypothetical protein
MCYRKAVKRKNNVSTNTLSHQFLKICCGPDAVNSCPANPYNAHSSDSIQEYVDFARKICHGDGDPREAKEQGAWALFMDFLCNVRIGGTVYAYGRSHDGEGFLLAALVRRLQNLHVQHLEGEIKDEVAMIDKRQTLVTPGGH